MNSVAVAMADQGIRSVPNQPMIACWEHGRYGMSDHFINLNCANCGAKLDVYNDMEQFACGHCGTEMIAQRRGGTVVLKAVIEAIKKVQIGTDKTAAELALVRLNQESVRLDEEVKTLTVKAPGIKATSKCVKCRAAFVAAVVGVFSWLLAISRSDPDSIGFGQFVFGVLVAVATFLLVITLYKAEPVSAELALGEKQILEKQAEIAGVKRRIAEQRRIVDSS
jgi:ribosomal protein S27E